MSGLFPLTVLVVSVWGLTLLFAIIRSTEMIVKAIEKLGKDT